LEGGWAGSGFDAFRDMPVSVRCVIGSDHSGYDHIREPAGFSSRRVMAKVCYNPVSPMPLEAVQH
jgi:hypothetical protein